MITAAFLLAGVIIDVIRLHSAMITATVIAADCDRMTSVITLTLNPKLQQPYTLTQTLLKESQSLNFDISLKTIHCMKSLS